MSPFLNFALIIFLSITIPLLTNCETMSCTDTNSQCSCTQSGSSQPCSLSCDSESVCSDTHLLCRSDDICSITCDASTACTSSTLDAQSATNVTITCNGDNACTSMTASCGTGYCILQCLSSNACPESLSVDSSSSVHFECIGYCPITLESYPIATAVTNISADDDSPISVVYQPIENTLSLHLTTTCYYVMAMCGVIVLCTCCMAGSFVFFHYKHTQQLLEAVQSNSCSQGCSHRDTLDTQQTVPSVPSVILTPAEQYGSVAAMNGMNGAHGINGNMGHSMAPSMGSYYHTLPPSIPQLQGSNSNVFNFAASNTVPHRYSSFGGVPCSSPNYSNGTCNVLPLPQTPKIQLRYSSEVSEQIADQEEDSIMEREGTEVEGTSMMNVPDLIAPASPKRKRRSLHMTQAGFMGEKVVTGQVSIQRAQALKQSKMGKKRKQRPSYTANPANTGSATPIPVAGSMQNIMSPIPEELRKVTMSEHYRGVPIVAMDQLADITALTRKLGARSVTAFEEEEKQIIMEDGNMDRNLAVTLATPSNSGSEDLDETATADLSQQLFEHSQRGSSESMYMPGHDQTIQDPDPSITVTRRSPHYYHRHSLPGNTANIKTTNTVNTRYRKTPDGIRAVTAMNLMAEVAVDLEISPNQCNAAEHGFKSFNDQNHRFNNGLRGLPTPDRSPRDSRNTDHNVDHNVLHSVHSQMSVYDALSGMVPVVEPQPVEACNDSNDSNISNHLYPPDVRAAASKEEESGTEISDLSSGWTQSRDRGRTRSGKGATETEDDDTAYSSVEVEEYSDEDEGSSTMRSEVRSRFCRGKHQRALQCMWMEQKEEKDVEWDPRLNGKANVKVNTVNLEEMIGKTSVPPLPESQSSVHSKEEEEVNEMELIPDQEDMAMDNEQDEE